MTTTSDMVGTLLQGTYRIERVLGEGGMGVVYEAAHRRLARRFAIKVLSRRVAAAEECVTRFRREAEVTSAIGHPHIVEVVDFNHTVEGLPYIVMELLEGEDLENRLERRGRLPLDQLTTMFCQAASALHAAHEKGVIHRDLKPGNIFLCQRGDRDDYVKVVDFGISKVLGGDTQITAANAFFGSPRYMAPEQAEMRPRDVDARTDVWAMGAILYEVLAGRPPFLGDSIPGLMLAIVRDDPVSLCTHRPELPSAVAETIHIALNKIPAQRHASMLEFWGAFSSALHDEGLEFDEPTTDVRFHFRPNQRGPLPDDTGPQVAQQAPRVTAVDVTGDTVAAAITGPGLPAGVTTLSAGAGELATTTASTAGTPRRWPIPLIIAGAAVLVGVVFSLGLQLGGPSHDKLAQPLARPTATPGADAAHPRPAGGATTDASARPRPTVAAAKGVAPRPAPATRALWLASNPPGAAVFIDGQRVGETPLLGVGVSADSAAVVLKLEGYEQHHIDLVSGARTARLGSIALRPVAVEAPKPRSRPRPRYGGLQISALSDGNPLPARILVDGAPLGEAPIYKPKLKPGRYVILASKAGYEPARRTVRVRAGRDTSVSLELSPR